MCGRFAFYSAAEAVNDLFGVTIPDDSVLAQYNIAPTDLAAVIRMDAAGERQLSMMRWGLVPFWAKDKKMASRMINARAETVAEKPAYRKAFAERRCLVPADGYYEWLTVAGKKRPHYIHRNDDQPLAMAGIWETWHGEDEPLETFSVLTMPSAGPIAHLHHRMPVMLDDVDAEHWLAGNEGNPPVFRDMNAEAYADHLDSRVVSTAVNNARNEDPRLIEPLDDDET